MFPMNGTMMIVIVTTRMVLTFKREGFFKTIFSRWGEGGQKSVKTDDDDDVVSKIVFIRGDEWG